MPDRIVEFHEPITLIGGGTVDRDRFQAAISRAPRLIAADGGANEAIALGRIPEAVIGDFDSVSAEALAAVPPEGHIRISEQETTDFEKCLMRIRAPYMLAVGFAGARSDHALAVWNALVRHSDRRCLILGETDLVFAALPRIDIAPAEGTRLSLFPMAPVGGASQGLRWPIGGVDFSPQGRIGTSNEVTGPVRLSFTAPGMLVILPLSELDRAITALRSAPGWR